VVGPMPTDVGQPFCGHCDGQDEHGDIPDAQLVEFAGRDHLPFWEGAESIIDEIEEFLTGRRVGPQPHRILTTVLFTDIVGSTQRAAEMGDGAWREMLTQHGERIRRQLVAFGGREVGTTGDGFLATFDSPASAVRSAVEMGRAVEEISLRIRAGVHTSMRPENTT
jgi:class 3 adenylate cyclase